jgi:hypothetical protein
LRVARLKLCNTELLKQKEKMSGIALCAVQRKRKIVTYATWSSNDDPDRDSEMNRIVGDLS